MLLTFLLAGTILLLALLAEAALLAWAPSHRPPVGAALPSADPGSAAWPPHRSGEPR